MVNGQKVWASGCPPRRLVPPARPHRPGCAEAQGHLYFLLDLRTPGIDIRPIRQATGESHFCEVFLDDVVVPRPTWWVSRDAGWQVAQATLGAERGMTMLELAERLGHGGFRWLVAACRRPAPTGAGPRRPARAGSAGRPRDRGHGAAAPLPLGRRGPRRRHPRRRRPVHREALLAKLLQRLTDFGAEVAGVGAHTVLEKPRSSGWESGAWVLDFIGSWEWTIPGGSSEIQRTIIGERSLSLPGAGVVSGLAPVVDVRQSVGASGATGRWSPRTIEVRRTAARKGRVARLQ